MTKLSELAAARPDGEARKRVQSEVSAVFDVTVPAWLKARTLGGGKKKTGA